MVSIRIKQRLCAKGVYRIEDHEKDHHKKWDDKPEEIIIKRFALPKTWLHDMLLVCFLIFYHIDKKSKEKNNKYMCSLLQNQTRFDKI